MITVGVKDAKNNLSRHLARVKEGEEVRITEGGKPIARIIKDDQGNSSVRRASTLFVNRHLIILPGRNMKKDRVNPMKVPGRPVSEIVIEDRRGSCSLTPLYW